MRTNRDPFDDVENAMYGEATTIDFSGDPGKTRQEPTEDADINVLMKRMGVKDGSQLPQFSSPMAMYGDFSYIPEDPQEAADMLYQGQLAFMRLPGAVRQRFGTPEELFKFMSNDKNYDQAVEMGLLAPKTPETTPPVSSSTSSVKE